MKKHLLIIFALVFTLSMTSVEANAAQMIELMEVEQQPAITFSSKDNVVHVRNTNGQPLHVYNIAGVCIKTFKVDEGERRIELNLPRGCYILKSGKTVRKITIK